MRCLVIGGTGLVGSAVTARLRRDGHEVTAVDSSTYAAQAGRAFDIVINCNGNASRHRAATDPAWDFEASVASVRRSLSDFACDRYIHVSTVDVYNDVSDPSANHEQAAIEPERLAPYGFHKWLAERLVERFAPRHVVLRLGTVIGPGLRKNPVFDLQQGRPVFMALESELSLIDSGTVGDFVSMAAVDSRISGTFNVSGSGSVRVAEIADRLGVRAQLAPGAEGVVYRYAINTAKAGAYLRLPRAAEALERYLSAAAA